MGSFLSEDANFLANFDVDLHSFYLHALAKELDIRTKKNAKDVKLALREVVEAYKKKSNVDDQITESSVQRRLVVKMVQPMCTSSTERADTPSIHFDSSAKRCAYVLKHSTCFTSAVARHVLGLAIESPQIFGELVQLGEIKLCCLGGGPATDAVGFSRVLGQLCRRLSSPKVKLSVHIIDINEDWSLTAGNVLDSLRHAPWMSGVELSFSFFSADLTRPLEEEVEDVLRSADVVTMVYFLSAVNRGRDTVESFRMVEEIMKRLKTGAILFFLDSAMDVHYKQMNSAANSVANLAQVYGPTIEEFHSLSIESVRKFIELYKRDFGRFLCLTNCFVTSAAWKKTDIKPKACNCNYCISMLNRLDNHGDNPISKTDRLLLDKVFATRTLQDRFSKMSLSMCNPKAKISTMVTIPTTIPTPDNMCSRNLNELSPDKTTWISLNYKSNNIESLFVGNILTNQCSYSIQDKNSKWANSNRQSVSHLTAKMLKFRAQIDRLLASEFDELRIDAELIDDVDPSPDDAFDNLLSEYIHSVPKYFFQTKSKKKRIFTGLPLWI